MIAVNNKIILSILIVSTIVSFFFLILFRKKNDTQAGFFFKIAIGLIAFWMICSILQILCTKIDPFIFVKLAYISICFLPVIFYLMSISFVKTKITFKPKYLLLIIIPILTLIVLWTDDFHHLFFKKYSESISETVYGIYAYISFIYTYTLFAISLITLIIYSIRNAGFFSKQAILITLGTLVPFLVNIIGALKIISMSIYITPMSFFFTIICLGLAIFKFNLLKSTPIALQRIVDRISDSYIVLNTNYEISDFNKTFINTFKIKDTAKIRGNSLSSILKNYNIDEPTFLDCFKKITNNDSTKSFELNVKDLKKSFNVEISSILNNGQILGILILFKDITQHKKDMETIKDNQNMLIERERLSSLGQMIGGIAHNLKTPIMSISGAAEGLKDLADELDNSIGNPIVTNDDYHDIAKDMKSWISKIKDYSEYMSDIITAVKGQAVNFTNDEEISFTISELLKRVDILMKHELKNAIVYLNVSVKTDENTIIKGDVNSLVQIINNMLSNAIQAYNGKPEQTIELVVTKENSNCIISIQDHAGGLPDKIKNKLFKEMVTTKGKNGTGLGLYMSYSTIRAHFNGDITFESEKGKGTTFNIILPL